VLAFDLISENASTLGTLIGAVIVSIFIQVASTIMSAIKREALSHKIKEVHVKVEEVKQEQVQAAHHIDGLLSELIDAVRSSALAKGRLEGIEEQKRRVATGDTGQKDPSI
jgi:hypothetical protein